MVKHGHQRVGKHQQGHGAGQRQEHHHAQAPIQHGRVGRDIPTGLGCRQARQQHHAHGHPEQRRGELHQPVGVGQPGHRPHRQVRGDLGVDQQGHLRHRHPQQRRGHLAQDALHARVGPGPGNLAQPPDQARGHAQATQGVPLHHQLQHPPDHDPGGHRIDGLHAQRLEPGRAPPRRSNPGQVQQHRGGGRNGKPLPGVQHAGAQRHQRHAGDVGKHQPRQEHRLIEGRQARGHQPDNDWRTHHPQHDGDEQHPPQDGGHRIHQSARGLVTVPLARGCQQGHEGLREGALGEQAAQQVGDAKRDVEGVGDGTGPEGRRHQLLPHQAGDPGGQRQQGNGRSRLEKVHGRQEIGTRNSLREHRWPRHT